MLLGARLTRRYVCNHDWEVVTRVLNQIPDSTLRHYARPSMLQWPTCLQVYRTQLIEVSKGLRENSKQV